MGHPASTTKVHHDSILRGYEVPGPFTLLFAAVDAMTLGFPLQMLPPHCASPVSAKLSFFCPRLTYSLSVFV
jgi:hypothetical protein